MMMRVSTMVGSVVLGLLLAGRAQGAPLANHYETDLDNYRICKPAPGGGVLGTCPVADVRSPSKYYLRGGTQGSIASTGTTTKLRINDIRIDDGMSFACQNETVPCDLDGRCPINPAIYCGGPTCTLPACQGGPKDGLNCNPMDPDAVCKNLDDVKPFGYVVFSSNYAGFEFAAGQWQFKLFGDAAYPDAGCTKVCAFNTLNDASPETGKVDDNALVCTLHGDCSAVQGFNRVTVVDKEGNPLALPAIGNAFIQGFLTVGGDPAKVGDACRGASPPADCP